MPIATVALTSFTGGEWSPRLHGRVDVAKYQSSCEVLENMILYPHGGITRRMGMEYIAEAKTGTVRLIPFEYNREQAYVLEFGSGYVRFYRDGGQIFDGLVPREISTAYLLSELPDISFAQSADVLYLCHPNHKPRKITRTGADIFAIADVSFTATPTDWNITDGYPGAVTFFQNRTVWGGHKKKPMTLWFSKSSDYENMTVGTVGTDGMSFTLSSHQVNAIQWLMPSKRLMVGTTGGEFTVYGGSGASITPTNFQVDRESNFGSKSGRVQLVGLEVLYSSRDGKKLRAMSYSLDKDGYDSPELSLFSEHITRPGIKEFDFAQNPDGILWTVLNDGAFAGFTYLKSQEVQGWHRHSTSGTVISVCTIEGDTGTETWFAVKRNGQTNVERMAAPFEGDEPNDAACAFLDSYLVYEGSPNDHISGLDHLDGMTVSVLGDGVNLGDFVVESGAIDLPQEVSLAVIGLKYRWRLVPLRLEGGSQYGISQGKKKRIESVILRVERSAGISHKIPGADTETQLPNRAYGENFDSEIPLYSGDLTIHTDPNWSREGQFELCGEEPFPVTILMASARVTVNE